MKIEKSSRAGSVESNDILIMLHPSNGGLQIDLESKVFQQYGQHIKSLIEKTLSEANVLDAHIIARDSGALDYTIQSRVKTAVTRAMKTGVQNESEA